MTTSISKRVTVRFSLEQLETRDLPSTLGAALPFLTDRVIVQEALKNSEVWTANFQTDFNALQSAIVHLGPNNPATIADLSRTMSDYGFAQQTFDFTDNTLELFKAGISFGISSGFFDELDVVPILFSLRDIEQLGNTSHSQEGTVNHLASMPFANGAILGGQHTISELSRASHI